MYNKKELKVTPKAEGKKNPYKKDIIYDPMGQWAHPGEVTRIPSGDITMQGVPYPVMGIDNFGNVQMMMPGQDYSFPGDVVDEYPMAKKGGVPRSLKKMYTSKNIQSSINEILMKRNDTLFGHSGRRYYKPMQDGGESDELYNMKRALELGYEADETGHWPSNDYETNQWLKSKKHPTAYLEFLASQLNVDLAKNYDVRVNPEGYFGEDQLQYVPKKQYGGWLDEFGDGGQKKKSEPIYVTDKNDPRLKAYTDSLNVYNDYKRLENIAQSKLKEESLTKKTTMFPRNPDGSICYNCIKKEAEKRGSFDPYTSDLYNQGFKQLVNPGIQPQAYANYQEDNVFMPDKSVMKFLDYSNAKPKQEVVYRPAVVTSVDTPLKKPVQPVKLKKKENSTPTEEQRIVKYTDKALYLKAKKAEDDSLKMHNDAILGKLLGQKDHFKGGPRSHSYAFTQPFTLPSIPYNKIKDNLSYYEDKVFEKNGADYVGSKENFYTEKIKPSHFDVTLIKGYGSYSKDEPRTVYSAMYKKPVIHNVYEEPVISETKPEVKPAPVTPVTPVKSDTHYSRNWEFSPGWKKMVYKDKTGKVVGEEFYNYKNELIGEPFKMAEGGETGWLDQYDKGGPLKVNKDLNQAFMRGEGRPAVIQPVHPKTMAEAQLIEDIKAKQALVKESNDKALYKKAKADGMTHNQAVAYVEMQNNPEEFFDQGTVSQGRDPQSGVGKFLEIGANPFTALREKTRHGHVPDYLNQNTDNEWYSPTSVADMLYQATVGAPFAVTNAAWNVPANLTEGDYIGAGLNAIDALPVIPNIGNYTKKGKDLIKSQRFVPDPNAYYRGIGKEGYKDAILNQAIKAKDPKAFHSPYFTKAGDFDVAKHFNPDIIVEAKGKKLTDDLSQLDPNDLVFARSNMGTVPVNHEVISSLDPYGNLGGDVFSVGMENIPLTNPNIRVLKKHWLKGYKEVDVPSQLPGSPNVAKAALPNPLGILDSFVPSINPFSFIADGGDLTSISPLNWIPGYGKSLKGEGKAYRKFGNDLSHVLETGTLSPKGGSKLRIGRGKIVNEGNWAALDKPWEKYPGVFTAEFDFKKPGSNLGYINPSSRNGVLITDAEKRTLPDIPVSDPGLEFHRRLPFSTRYIPLDKEKILAGKFQLGQAGSHLQSLAEKYGRGLGLIGTAGAVTGQGEEAMKWYNDHTINPIIESIKEGINDPAGIIDRTKRDWNKLTQKRGGQVDWLLEFE